MGGNRNVTIGCDPMARRFFARIPGDPSTGTPERPFAAVLVGWRRDSTGHQLEISTSDSSVFRELHRFTGLLTEDLETAGGDTTKAFATAVDRWGRLFRSAEIMSREQQVGLLAELLFLVGLIQAEGPESVLSWTGRAPAGPGRHDFELVDVDVEVKATTSRERWHFVHGTQQLQAAPDRALHLLSFRFEPSGAGPGRTLSGEVARIRELLGGNASLLAVFENNLRTTGYRDDHAPYLSGPLRQADRARLVPVNNDCPRLTQANVETVLTPQLTARLRDLSYRINVDGLGAPEGSDEFSAVLGTLRTEA
jgi:hypothetical protein